MIEKDYSKKDLLALPMRDWDKVSRYTSILVLPSNHKHDSGYQAITLIGQQDTVPIEIITQSSDDIHLYFETNTDSWCMDSVVRMDCLPRSKAFRYWSTTHIFEVSAALSSMDVKLIKK